MPIAFLILGAGALIATISGTAAVAVDNATQKPTSPVGGGTLGNSIPWFVVVPVAIAGTIVLTKYGSKLIKKL